MANRCKAKELKPPQIKSRKEPRTQPVWLKAYGRPSIPEPRMVLARLTKHEKVVALLAWIADSSDETTSQRTTLTNGLYLLSIADEKMQRRTASSSATECTLFLGSPRSSLSPCSILSVDSVLSSSVIVAQVLSL